MRAFVVLGSIGKRARARVGAERGFTLVETIIAISLMAIVATSLVGLLASAYTAQKLSRQKTFAQQTAQDQIERVRRMSYDAVGVPNGNPTGTLTSQSITKVGFDATVNFKVQYVSDPTPTGYVTLANYKKVTATIVRDSDSKTLAQSVTYVAPAGRAPYGGINYASVKATVIDMGNNTPYPGVSVGLASTTPSVTRADVTDAAGAVTFPALTANPDGTKFYTLTVTPPSGYQNLSDDVSPSSVAKVSLAPSQAFNTALRIFKPAVLNLAFTNSAGGAYNNPSTVTVSSSRQTQTFSVSGSSFTVNNLNGEPIIPGLQYTVVGKTTTPLCGNPAPKYVPDNYPTVMTSTITTQYIACPSGSIFVNVKRNGSNQNGATVTVTLGPNNISYTGTTDSSGNVTFANVPSGTGYTVKAWNCSVSTPKGVTQTGVSVSTGVQTSLNLAFANGTCPQ